ncbi:MAG TPA: AMP-binding protein [Humidesulfovibrio sp.]|uniref:AMP-binding protein n=1 Tax=Humidesulfovibrio sp. TaxID=2910988 RepID=UPI002CE86EEA|nr:AMP-binding protein [Humidesulfovibrio sp.]HWR04462.1 AMP-binding protein [Humidesulfovibrio sp.]
MPREQAIREATLGQILDETVAKWPNRDAVVYVDRDYRLTWRQFSDLVDEVAMGLMAMGVQKGEKVGIWANNVPYWVVLMFATAKIGAVLLTVNTHYRKAEIEYLLKQSDCENLVLIDGFRDTDYVGTIYDLAPELKTTERGHAACARFPHLKRVIFLGAEKHRGMYSMSEVQALSVMTTPEEYEARQATLTPHDVVNMQYTSGTTGFPKGVQLTHNNIGNNGYWIGENQNFTEKDRLCLGVPLFHCFGCVLGVMACVTHGTAMVILENFDPVMAMTSVEEEKCTAIYGVPTMFISMLEHKLFKRFDFSTLRTGIMAGSPCPIEFMKRAMNEMNMREITICYGLTEGSPVMTQTRIGDSLRQMTETVGRAMPEIEVCIKDPETGEESARGVVGEICCRGYNVMKGYYNNPEATAKAIDMDGWLHSGDLGVMDEEGYVTVTGRLKDMIIRGGENVYPREIEEFLYRMDGILDVQVVGVPSRKFGEEVGAFVILKPDAHLEPEDVKDYCRGQIARYKIPKYIAFVDAYPMTASGKIQKYKLRELAGEMFPEAMQEPPKV